MVILNERQAQFCARIWYWNGCLLGLAWFVLNDPPAGVVRWSPGLGVEPENGEPRTDVCD